MMLLLTRPEGSKVLLNMDHFVCIEPYHAGTILWGFGENNCIVVKEDFDEILAQFNYSVVFGNE